MNFSIEIRHIESGLAKVFATVEELAEHLKAHVKEEWEGWQPLRAHPALQALDAQPAAAELVQQFPGEPVVTLAPEGVFVEGAGVVSLENLQQAGVPVADPDAPQAPAADVYLPAG